MNKNIYVVTSNTNNKFKVEAVFSNYEFAEKFCDLENSMLDDFRRQDEGFYIKNFKLDSRKVPENQCYKSFWDFKIIINKDVQEYGKILYVGTSKELVHVNKTQDVEIYNDEVIYCRSYISKREAEDIAKETWQMYEQKQAVKEGI